MNISCRRICSWVGDMRIWQVTTESCKNQTRGCAGTGLILRWKGPEASYKCLSTCVKLKNDCGKETKHPASDLVISFFSYLDHARHFPVWVCYLFYPTHINKAPTVWAVSTMSCNTHHLLPHLQERFILLVTFSSLIRNFWIKISRQGANTTLQNKRV